MYRSALRPFGTNVPKFEYDNLAAYAIDRNWSIEPHDGGRPLILAGDEGLNRSHVMIGITQPRWLHVVAAE